MKNQGLLIAGLVIGALGIALLLFILMKIFRKSTKSNPINVLFLISGFLVTSYFYPSGIKSIIQLIKSFFIEVLSIFIGSQSDIPRSDRIISSVFDSQTWYNSIMFVAGFTLLAFLLSETVKYFNSFDETRKNNSATNRKTTFKNVIVALVLTIALYFSFSSIIAVPIVSFQSDDETLVSEELKEELETYSRNDSVLKQEYIHFIERKSKLLNEDTLFTDVISLFNNFSDYKREVNMLFRELELIKKRAYSRIKITDNSNIYPKLKLKDKSELSTWYLENRSRYLGYLNKQQYVINLFTNKLLLEEGGEAMVYSSVQQIIKRYADNIRPLTTPMPARPTLGSDLGVFTLFAGWLLSVESYALVIIVGLIGFGLLGAGGSTFIKEKRSKENKVLINDLAGVLIKGFTAAIVIFLGVQGGLAILTTKSDNLNAYALFFVCFVAAVFSDNAWDWAKKRFSDDFKSDDTLITNDVQNDDAL